MQRYFARRGIGSTAAALGGTISTYSVHAAPLSLQNKMAAAALAKAAQNSAAGPSLTATIVTVLKSHALLAGTLAALFVAGTGGYFAVSARPPSPPHGQPPLAIVGVGLLGRNPATRKFEVRRVFPNSPADRAGIAPGLVVNKINNVVAETKSVKELSQLLAGPVGTKVEVEIVDADG